MFIFKSKKKKLINEENEFISGDLKKVEVTFCKVDEIEAIFPIYLKEFIQNGNYDIFKDALLSNVSTNIDSTIKILEARIEADRIITKKIQHVFNYWFFITSAVVAIVILIANNLDKTQNNTNYIIIYSLIMIIILLFKRKKTENNAYINPNDMKSLFYTHCLEILEEQKEKDIPIKIKKFELL